MVMGIAGACGRINLTSLSLFLPCQCCTASAQPWPESPRPWMKMTVAVWRPEGVNTMGAARRIDDMVDEAVEEADGCRNARTELAAAGMLGLPYKNKMMAAISGTERLIMLTIDLVDMKFARSSEEVGDESFLCPRMRGELQGPSLRHPAGATRPTPILLVVQDLDKLRHSCTTQE